MKNYKKYYLTSESVTEGHPDKVCDYISDSILDACLEQDENSRVAVETFISNGKVTIAGQITSNATLDIENIVREKLKEVGYDSEKYNMDYRTCNIYLDEDSYSYEEYAENEIHSGELYMEDVLPYIDLETLGKDLIEDKNAKLTVGQYMDNDRIAVCACTEEEYYGDITKNLPNTVLENENSGFISDYIKSSGLEDKLIKEGIIEKVIGTVQYNMGRYDEVVFNLEKLKEYDRKGVERYLQNEDAEEEEFE